MKGLFVLFAVIAAAAANQCPQEDNVEKLLSHEDCNKFYKCTYGEPVEQDCPVGLYFSLELERCDWPQLVNCGDRNIPALKIVQAPEQPEAAAEDCEDKVEKEEIELNEIGCPVKPNVHWLLPHEEDCSLFYYCEDGHKILSECSESMHFNSKLQVCDWPSDAGCAVSANKHLSGRLAFRQFA